MKTRGEEYPNLQEKRRGGECASKEMACNKHVVCFSDNNLILVLWLTQKI